MSHDLQRVSDSVQFEYVLCIPSLKFSIYHASIPVDL